MKSIGISYPCTIKIPEHTTAHQYYLKRFLFKSKQLYLRMRPEEFRKGA